ncbi:PLP-dependent aminotransferase family protein [uncultured Bradyrhizobium sp.]|uniref:MocR-like pyridoxine biosynthesis transcription factor PdxR n=1 Tax=uncultured Bradyrhizobium sp. TaxID=199684 RepID=UPI00262850ED|nr:PLP-dependent aminotransferase family protein [uncultured Bradyrhizobium sp.]
MSERATFPKLPMRRAMRRESAAAGFRPAIDSSLPVPAVRQLYLQLRDAIVGGALRAGDRLPSTRTASAEWSLSRGLVAEAYDVLIAEGYAIGKHGSGTYVTDDLPLPKIEGNSSRNARSSASRRRISAAARLAMSFETHPGQVAFATGRVIHDMRTAVLLKRLAHRHIDYASDGYRDAQGEPALREAVAAYLTASRGVRCDPRQVFITSGTQQALDLAIRVLMSPGETALVENPCYPPARQAFLLNGARLVGAPVDSKGMITETLASSDGLAPVVIYVTPSHQYPSGSALPLTRRLQLLAFAQRQGSWIIEDDYDSEFRYEGHPIASLQGLDTGGCVIYAGSFSKALLPGFRVGYLVVPDDLVAAFRAVRPIVDRFPAPLHQLVVADFLSEGYFPAHLRRLRESSRASRDLLFDLLKERLSEHLVALLPEQGVHLTARSTGSWRDDCALARAALDGGVVVIPTSPMHIGAPAEPRLLLGFSGLTAAETDIATRRLAEVFRSSAKTAKLRPDESKQSKRDRRQARSRPLKSV